MELNRNNKAITHLQLYATGSQISNCVSVTAKRSDVNSRWLAITIADKQGQIHFDPGAYPVLNATHNDGSHFDRIGEIGDDGIAYVYITSDMLSKVGRLSADVTVIGTDTDGNGYVLTTETFYIIVSETNFDGDGEEAEDAPSGLAAEIATLKADLNDTVANAKEDINRVADTASAIANESKQIAQDAKDSATILKTHAVGERVVIDDLSPVSHELTIDVTSETVAEGTEVVIHNGGKNLIDPILYCDQSDSTTTLNGDVFTTTFTSGTLFLNKKAYLNKNPLTALKAGTYTATIINCSKDEDGENTFMSCALFCYPIGSEENLYTQTMLDIDGATSVTFTAETDFVMCVAGAVGHYGVFSYKLMLEAGSTATEYESYIGMNSITAAVGERITMQSSEKNIFYTDTPGVVLDVEYARDLNKAYDEMESYAEIVSKTAVDKYLVDLTFRNLGANTSNTLVSNMIRFNDPMSSHLGAINSNYVLGIDMYDENKKQCGSSGLHQSMSECTFVDGAVYLMVYIYDESGSIITPNDVADFKYWDNVYASSEAAAKLSAEEAKASEETAKLYRDEAEGFKNDAEKAAELTVDIWRKAQDSEFPYDNTGTDLKSTNIQDAITELATAAPYDNSKSTLTSETIPGAINELAGAIDKLDTLDWKNITSFETAQQAVRAGLARYIYEVGDQLMCERTVDGKTVTLVWDIIGIDVDKPADVEDNYIDGNLLKHSMTLQLSEAFCPEDFARPEALIYAGEGVPTGTYYCYTNSTYLKYGYHTFTTTEEIPAGGRIGFEVDTNSVVYLTTYDENDNKLEEKIRATTSTSVPTSMASIFSIEGTEKNNEMYVAHGRYDYIDSYIRKYLQGETWIRTNNFEIKPSWVDTKSWFAKGFDEDFLNVLGLVEKETYYESQGGVVSHNDLFFLLSQNEVYGGANAGVWKEGLNGEAYPYYEQSPYTSAPTMDEDANRVKGYMGEFSGGERPWWLRSRGWDSSIACLVSWGGKIIPNARSVDKKYSICPACCII